MEAVGLAVGVASLAGLFSACVECFNYIDLGRNYERDSEILFAKFHIQRVRLCLWGKLVGLAGGIEEDNLKILAQQELGLTLCLRGIQTLLTNSKDLTEKYGLVGMDEGEELENPQLSTVNRVGKLRSSLSAMLPKQVDGVPGVLDRAKWALRDKDKFITLVEDLKDFVDGLHGVVPAIQPRHNRLVERGISSIRDNDALELVCEATEDDYPDWSEKASVVLKGQTWPSPERRKLLAWVEDGSSPQARSITKNHIDAESSSAPAQGPELGIRHRIKSLLKPSRTHTLNRPYASSTKERRSLHPVEIQHLRAILRRFTKACKEEMSPSECLDIIGTNQDLSTIHVGGSTWAHVAVECGHGEVLEALLLAGADVDARDRDGRTPLILAAKSDNGELVKLLLGSKANVEAKDYEGRTALFFAMCHNLGRRKYWRHQSTALNALLEAGADINARDKGGVTPLHYFLTWVRSVCKSAKDAVCGPLERLEELNQNLDITRKSYSGVSLLDLLVEVHDKVYDGEELALNCIAQGVIIRPKSIFWKHSLVAASRNSDWAYVKFLVWRSELSGQKPISPAQLKEALFAGIEARSLPVAKFLVPVWARYCEQFVHQESSIDQISRFEQHYTHKGYSILQAVISNDFPELTQILESYIGRGVNCNTAWTWNFLWNFKGHMQLTPADMVKDKQNKQEFQGLLS